MAGPAKPITIYVDADACPVKAEIYRVAERYSIKVYVVCNSVMAVPRTPLIERVSVGGTPDAADDWIAQRVSRGAIVITTDVPLAHRCVKAGADVIAPTGRTFAEASIGMTLAVRDLMADLRSAGQIGGGPKPFQQRDRANFLCALDLAVVRLKRDGFAA
ncbi:MAG: YaiI/YqxD family protein [Rhodomicrobium sp.]